jgi:hypothetical protein
LAQDFGAGRISGDWCAQGDKTKRCSISSNGAFLTFTNENGSKSTGHFVNMQQTVFSADEWQFVQGTLSPDGLRIDWTNGTYWMRCGSSGGGGRRPNLDGTWYRDGNRSQACSIRQKKGNLHLRMRAARPRPDPSTTRVTSRPTGPASQDWWNHQPRRQYHQLGQRHIVEQVEPTSHCCAALTSSASTSSR